MIDNISHWCMTSFLSSVKDTVYKQLSEALDKREWNYLRLYGSSHSGKTSLVKRVMLRSTKLGYEPKAGEEWPPESEDERIPWIDIDIPLYQFEVTRGPNRENYLDKTSLITEFLSVFEPDLPEDEERQTALGDILLAKSYKRPVIILHGGFYNEHFEKTVAETIGQAITNFIYINERREKRKDSSYQERSSAQVKKDVQAALPIVIFEYWLAREEDQGEEEQEEEEQSSPQNGQSQTSGRKLPTGNPPVGEFPDYRITVSSMSSDNSYRNPLLRIKPVGITVEGLETDKALSLIKEVISGNITGDGNLSEILTKLAQSYTGGHLGCMILFLEALNTEVERRADFRDLLSSNSTNQDELAKVIEDCIIDVDADQEYWTTRSIKQLLFSLDIKRAYDISNDRRIRRRLLRQKVATEDQGVVAWTKLISLILPTIKKSDPPGDRPIVKTLSSAMAVLVGWYKDDNLRHYVDDHFATDKNNPIFKNLIESGQIIGLESAASAILEQQTQQELEALIEEVELGAIKVLRTNRKFSKKRLEIFWQNYNDTEEEFQDMWTRVGGQVGAAGQIARAATRKRKLAALLNEMMGEMESR